MVEIDALTKRYAVDDGEIVALSAISVAIAEGEFVCVLGPSGCGKSTLLKIVAGLIEPSGGTIRIDGRAVTAPGPDRAVVFQDYALFPWMTVADNVEFGLAARGVEMARRRRVSTELLRAVGLADFAQKYPHHLSGGMKQRVSIARALAVDPVLLLMDEPFGALDAQTRFVMQQELLRIWRAYRKTVLFVTHSIDEALFLADRVLVMTARPGRVKAEIRVTPERPRDIASAEFSRLRRQALELLSDEIARSMEQEAIAGVTS
ncbi:MAG TPA: ABC transporter ATP-binding protein [Methylomirabilota bacterium]|nr:ABC transporter ATP-binding protein [Methylomirabilota bacterium]